MIAVVAFPYAAMDLSVVTAAATPKPAYEMGAVDVGSGFGKVEVEELMDYYVENPPIQTANAAAAPKIRFGGC